MLFDGLWRRVRANLIFSLVLDFDATTQVASQRVDALWLTL